MISPSYEKIFTALSQAKVRFLVVGGIAMNAHGLTRSTFDLDLVVFLDKQNVLKFTKTMKELGYIPKVPVNPDEFSNEEIRKQWIEEKNMVVFSYRHDQNMMDIIDVFVDHPFPFEEMWNASKKIKLGPLEIQVAGIEHMIKMKQKASRPKDDMDLRYLDAIMRKKKEN